MDKPVLLGLIRKYLLGKASQEEQNRLNHWYHSVDHTRVEWPATSDEEEREIEERIWTRLRQLPGLSPRSSAGKLSPLTINRVWTAAAAVLVLLTGFAVFMLEKRALPKHEFVELANAAASVTKLTLPDGSEVWLNANTKLSYSKNFSEQREIRLEGEAFFDVRPGKAPFIVHAAHLDTKVLGTSFDIRSYINETEASVSVHTGKVQVQTPDGKKQHTGIVQPGQAAIYDPATNLITIRTTTPSDTTDWKNGELTFRSLNLRQICHRLENWYGYQIVLSDPNLASYEYNASFHNTISLKELLTILCDINNIRFTIDDQTRSVLLKKSSH